MSNTTNIKASELIGPALDWAVATAEGLDVRLVTGRTPAMFMVKIGRKGGPHMRAQYISADCEITPEYSPSTIWAQGGPLIDKYGIDIDSETMQGRRAILVRSDDFRLSGAEGSTSLVAAMRAIVSAKLGNTISVPAELTPTR